MHWRPPRLLALLALLALVGQSRAWTLQAEWRDNGLDLVWTMDEQPGLVTRQERDWLTIDLPAAGHLGRPGEPALPLVSRLVELPAGSGLQVEVVEQVWESVPGLVLPEQEAVHTAADLPQPWREERAAYVGAVYPEQAWLLGDPALIRGVRVRQLALVPARSLPAKGATELLRRARLRVTFAGSDNRNNPSGVLAFARRAELLPDGVLSHPQLVQEFDRVGASDNPGAYLVIARGAGITGSSYFQDWIAWKRQKGHQVTVAGVAQIPAWNASAIREYLRTAVGTWSDPPVYVALVGDHTGSGDFYLPTSTTGTNGEYDHYYSLVDGTDHLADVAVGRLSCENATQLNTICNKLLHYETTPTAGGSAWLARAALCTGYNAISMIQQSRTIVHDMVREGITAVDTLWYPNTTASWVNGRFNAGIALYNYRGWIGMQGVDNTFISNAGNFLNYGMPPVTGFFTCSTGDFESTCETEVMLRKGDPSTPQGGSAVIGFATSNTHTAYNNAIAGGFWSAFLDRGVSAVGSALIQGKLELFQTLPPGDPQAERFSNWANLMGDPGMEMWCGVPTALSATLAQGGSTFALGATEIQIQVNAGGSPATDVLVCLWQAGGLQSRGLTDAHGRVWLPTAGTTAGAVNLTATKVDHLPARVTLTVAGSQFPRLAIWNIPDDGKLQPGETVTLLPSVQNMGGSPLTGLALNATSLAEGLTLGDATATWPTIGAGATVGANSSLSATAAPDLPDATRLQLGLAYTSGQGAFQDGADLLVSAPRLQPGTLSFNPGGSILQPGTTALLTLPVTNTGNLAASALTVSLDAPGDPFVVVTSAPIPNVNLAQNASTNLSFTVQASGATVRGHRVSFLLSWSGGGLQGNQAFTATVGTATAMGPTGPDAYGYFAIEGNDANSLAPVFQWEEIAPSAGGSGTSLGLTDFGDSQDDAATVTLPFTFIYYGQPYTQLAVCSNGFVAFGPGAVNQTDYRNHYLPSGLGPDAMIAAAWDDHIIPGGGGVYYKSEPANHRFIVEWHQLQHNGSGGTNTFQVILIDPAHSQGPTGDGDILLQYNTWNNTQSNSYDFPGCTVGMKDERSARGLTLTNHLIDDPTIQGFGNGKAILITTAEGFHGDSAAPSIALAQVSGVQPGESPAVTATIIDASGVAWATLHHRVGLGVWQSSALSNLSGDTWAGALPGYALGSVVEYYVQAQDLADPPNTGESAHHIYTVVVGTPPTGPDAYGYRWYDSADGPEGPDFIWQDISGQGTQLSLGDDQTAVVNLPFPVVYFGASHTQLSVCSNGFATLGNDTYSGYTNASMATGNGTGKMVCAFWDDLNPASGGQVRVATEAGGNRFVVSWLGVPRYGTSDAQTLQLVFLNQAVFPTVTGDTPILAQYQVVGVATSCTVGHQNSGRNVGISYLHNGTLAVNAAPVVSGQSLLLTTGAQPLGPVTGLTAGVNGGNLVLNWNASGAQSYRVYSGAQAWAPHLTLETTVAGTSATLPVVGASRWFDVRGVRDYQAAGLALERVQWLPVEVGTIHPAATK
jgi:hypothetical protein